VSKPYYNFFLHSFGLPLAPADGHRPARRLAARLAARPRPDVLHPVRRRARHRRRADRGRFASSLPGLLAYTFSAFAGAAIVLEFWRGTRATGSIVRLVGRNRRRYGGYLYASILLFAIRVAGSSAYQTVRRTRPAQRQELTVAGYTLRYDALGTRQEPNAVATRATIDVSRDGSHVTTLHPGKNTYPVEKETSNEVAIYHDPRNLGDVF
jgi:cytochrome c biogenesis factor